MQSNEYITKLVTVVNIITLIIILITGILLFQIDVCDNSLHENVNQDPQR